MVCVRVATTTNFWCLKVSKEDRQREKMGAVTWERRKGCGEEGRKEGRVGGERREKQEAWEGPGALGSNFPPGCAPARFN